MESNKSLDIEVGSEIGGSGQILKVPVGKNLLGRVIGSTGTPLDGKGTLEINEYYPAFPSPQNQPNKQSAYHRFVTGVRCIDSFLACGKGQRFCIFGGSGVGKTSLLSMIARNSNADVKVIALIGDREREVNDFIEHDLGKDGMERSVVVVAKSDEPAISRVNAAYVASAIAEYFRDIGKNVVLMIDSLSRFAYAQREIGLAKGEPPIKRGYPQSAFDVISKLIERTGTSDKGSVTAFYNVLVDNDDTDDPITERLRDSLDGYIVLSRALAQKGHYPAIDVLKSSSRLPEHILGSETLKATSKLRRLIAIYEDNKDMIASGRYQKGTNAEIDLAIEKHKVIEKFLCQEANEPCTMSDTLQKLSAISETEIPAEEYIENPAVSTQ